MTEPIFENEGIKAPDVQFYGQSIVVALYYVFHLFKFNSIYRKNTMKDTHTYDGEVATFPIIPSLMLDKISWCVLNPNDDSVTERFSQVFNTDSNLSVESLFKQIDWNYLKDSKSFEGFTAGEGDNPLDYITLEASSILIFASNYLGPQVTVKKKN